MLQESGVLDDYVEQLTSEDPGERDRAGAVVSRLVQLDRTDLLQEIASGHPDARIRRNLSDLLGAPSAERSA